MPAVRRELLHRLIGGFEAISDACLWACERLANRLAPLPPDAARAARMEDALKMSRT